LNIARTTFNDNDYSPSTVTNQPAQPRSVGDPFAERSRRLIGVQIKIQLMFVQTIASVDQN
jgi:hypothetical protein